MYMIECDNCGETNQLHDRYYGKAVQCFLCHATIQGLSLPQHQQQVAIRRHSDTHPPIQQTVHAQQPTYAQQPAYAQQPVYIQQPVMVQQPPEKLVYKLQKPQREPTPAEVITGIIVFGFLALVVLGIIVN